MAFKPFLHYLFFGFILTCLALAFIACDEKIGSFSKSKLTVNIMTSPISTKQNLLNPKPKKHSTTTSPVIQNNKSDSSFSKSYMSKIYNSYDSNKKTTSHKFLNHNKAFNSQKVFFDKNSIAYIAPNRNFLSITNIHSKNSLIIGQNINFSFKINFKNQNNNTFIHSKTIHFPFNSIYHCSVDSNGDFYVLDLQSSTNHSKPNLNQKNNSVRHNYNNSLIILKFNKHGKLIFKIGKSGKINNTSNIPHSLAFNDQGALHLLYTDKNNYLYLIFKDFKQNNIRPFNLFVFDHLGQLLSYKKNVSSIIPSVQGYSLSIEDIKISPLTKKLVFLAAYYPQDRLNSKEKYLPAFKRIYSLNIDLDNFLRNKLKPILTLRKDFEIDSSIFGITAQNNIFLYSPNKFSYNNQNFMYNYFFNIININTKSTSSRSIQIPKVKDIYNINLDLSPNENIAFLVSYQNKIVAHFYN